MDDREQRVRKRAHELWQKDGEPDGFALHHWLQAEAEIDRVASAAAYQGAKPGSSAADNTIIVDTHGVATPGEKAPPSDESAIPKKSGAGIG